MAHNCLKRLFLINSNTLSMQNLAPRWTAYLVGDWLKGEHLRLKYVSKKDEIKRRIYKETELSKNVFFQKCQSSTKLVCNVPTNSTTKHCAAATIFHAAKIKHGQSLQELSNDCILFDILKPIVCIDYFKIKTTCKWGQPRSLWVDEHSYTEVPWASPFPLVWPTELSG